MSVRGVFIGRILIEPMDAFWCVREAFDYVTTLKLTITVPEGFLTDGASVPPLFWNLFSPFDKRYLGAAIVHDFLYATHLVDRLIADNIFVEATIASERVQKILYEAVRAGGENAFETGPARQLALKQKLAEMGLG